MRLRRALYPGLILLVGVLTACSSSQSGAALPAPPGPPSNSAGTTIPPADSASSTVSTPVPSTTTPPGTPAPTAPPLTAGPPTRAPSGSSTSASSTTASTAGPSVAPDITFPGVGLVGVNDTSCTSSHRPVVLLPGTFSTVGGNYADLAPALIAAGYCLYGLDLGGATQAVRTSADAAATFVGQVLTVTGSTQVDVVGFSQGGLILRTALRENGLADQVHTAVLISPSFHGSTAAVLDLATPELCQACLDQQAGSALLTSLAAGGDLDGSVRYSVVVTRSDSIVTPYTSQIPAGPPDRVRSVVLQDACPGNRTSHQDMPFEPAVVRWVRTSLEADGRPDTADFSCAD